jgi:hypothetical protein
MKTIFADMHEATMYYYAHGYRFFIEYAGVCRVMIKENGQIDAPMVELHDVGFQKIEAVQL